MADAATGKAQAAREVCAASAAFVSFPHRRRSPRRPPFVDWYLVLAVRSRACTCYPSSSSSNRLYFRRRVNEFPVGRSARPHRRRPSSGATATSVRIHATVPLLRLIDDRTLMVNQTKRFDIVMCDLFAALQLHPDKNRHPKAELAFKLVAEVLQFTHASLHSASLITRLVYSLRVRIG
jgi:hypothetical protein